MCLSWGLILQSRQYSICGKCCFDLRCQKVSDNRVPAFYGFCFLDSSGLPDFFRCYIFSVSGGKTFCNLTASRQRSQSTYSPIKPTTIQVVIAPNPRPINGVRTRDSPFHIECRMETNRYAPITCRLIRKQQFLLSRNSTLAKIAVQVPCPNGESKPRNKVTSIVDEMLP